jgi:threonine/homoserine/homoserine lactone efflux protein
MGIHDYWLFVAAGLLLNITPGPDLALVISRAATQGARSGAAAALGIGAGTFAHIAAAAIGLSALLVTSAWAFTVLKWAGAIYLIYVGLLMVVASFRAPLEPAQPANSSQTSSLRGSFAQGFLTNVLNPKVAIFFLAFVPQFIDPESPVKASAFFIRGLTFNFTGTVCNLLFAFFADRLGRVSGRSDLKVWLDRVVGGVFVAFGVRLALVER